MGTRSILHELRHGLFNGDAESTSDILVFKIVEAYIVYRAIEYCLQWGFFTQNIGEVVLPLGIAAHVDISFMFENDVSVFTAAAATILMIVGFFRANRFAYLGAFVLFHLQFAARFCLGEIPHSSNFVGLGILALGLGALLHEDGPSRRRFVTGVMIFFIGLGYFTSGVSKLVATGIVWPDGNHLWIWIAEKAADKYSEFGVLTLNSTQRMMLDHWWMATAALASGLLVELAALGFWFSRTRTGIAACLIGLHIGVYLTMRIVFSANIHLVALVGFPWARWLKRYSPEADARLKLQVGRQLVRWG